MSPRSALTRTTFYLSLALTLISSAAWAATTEGDFTFWPEVRYDPAVPTFEDVLGHAPGESILSHREILTYLNALQAAQPERLRVEEYARSWENRPLIYSVVGSADSIGRLSEIRSGLQQLADVGQTSAEEAAKLIETLPAVTWLAYGVHGNEVSSPDAALLTAYHLLAAQSDPVVELILANSLVVIDPTQNPDGRDRFVHNFRTSIGLLPDGDPLAAEHNEPWPGGRTNHYFFDLNRDWFALTQPETRGRIRVLQELYPQVFIDLHEMGSNSTYYFTPEALPYNPHIPAPQRAKLELYGRNNARWFDRFGFDYFTREVYDAFYPGYGASWPLFQGSVAATYEQASPRGLVYRRRDGSDLHFRDAVRQHFVASLATAETTAKHRRKLLQEFYDYRKGAVEAGRRSGAREYIFPDRGGRSALSKLAGVLTAQGVEVRRATSTLRACGVEYPAGSYAVSLAQPTHYLIRTLLDSQVDMEDDFLREQERRRRKRLPDEIYDVTAWSLPLLYNLESVACGEEAKGSFELFTERPPSGELNARAEVAYLAPWGSRAAGRLLAAALRRGLKVWSSDKPFVQAGRSFPSGTLVFKVASNGPGLHDTLAELAAESGAEVVGTDTGWVEEGVNFGSRHVLPIPEPRIALAWDRPTSSNSAGATRFVLERQFGYPVTAVRVPQLTSVDLARFDVLILPEGRYAGGLDARVGHRLLDWTQAGGTLIGLGSAVDYLSDQEVGLLDLVRENRSGAAGKKPSNGKEEEAKTLTSEEDFLRAVEPLSEAPSEVAGVLAWARVDPDHWLGAGVPERVSALVRGRRIYSPITLDNGTNVAFFMGAEELLASGFLWEDNRRQLAYKPLVVVQPRGRGMVIAFTSDPNFRAYLDGLNVFFLNAVFRGPAHARLSGAR